MSRPQDSAPFASIGLSALGASWESQSDFLFSVSGADHVRYLHGRLSQDVKGLAPHTPVDSLLLSPQGKVQGACSLWRTDSAVVLWGWGAKPVANQFLSSLLQFKISDRVEVASIPVQRSTSLCRDPVLSHPRVEEAGGGFSFTETFGALSFKHHLTTGESLVSANGGQTTDGLDRLFHLVSFRPRFGMDIGEQTLGTELPSGQFVSFVKGCYVGQEVVEMAKSRGRSPRRLTRVRFESNTAPTSPLEFSLAESKTAAVTGGVFFPGAGYGFGFAVLPSEAEIANGGDETNVQEISEILLP